MTNQNEIFRWATKVYEFMYKHPAPGDWAYAFEHESEMSYAEALARWSDSGKSIKSFYSTEDPDMIALKDELTKEFGLEVVSRAEGMKRNAPIKPVCGWIN